MPKIFAACLLALAYVLSPAVSRRSVQNPRLERREQQAEHNPSQRSGRHQRAAGRKGKRLLETISCRN
jgi:hypothetical protein